MLVQFLPSLPEDFLGSMRIRLRGCLYRSSGFFYLLVLIAPTCFFPLMLNANSSVLPFWNQYRDQADLLYRQLLSVGMEQLDRRQERVNALTNVEDWECYQAQIRLRMQTALGEFPKERPALNPVVTDRIELENATIEKLYFESLPGYPVTAALFLPKGASGKLPAIIWCSGHAASAFRTPSYQTVILNYVDMGFAVLAFDPIGQGERAQYWDTKNKVSLRAPTHDHSYSGAPGFLVGRPLAWYFVWDGIRAVDYLHTRPEIDVERIGITGRSGGGTQAVWIGAFDPRIAAVATDNYVTTMRMLLRSMGPQDAEQNLPFALREGIDITDFLIAIAPRPLLINSTTNDIFSMQGARDAFAEAGVMWQMLGAADAIQMTEDYGGHESTQENREAAYSFFRRFLNNPGEVADTKKETLSEQELFVTKTGNVFTSIGSESIYSLNRSYAQGVLETRRSPSNRILFSATSFRELVADAIGYEVLRSDDLSLLYSGGFKRDGYSIEKYLIERNGKSPLPLLYLKPVERSRNKAVLLLSPEGKSALLNKSSIAEDFALRGFDVFVVDLSGVGELITSKRGDSLLEGTSFNLWFMGILTGKSILAAHTEEIIASAVAIRKIAANGQIDFKIAAISYGFLSEALLHAELLGGRFEELVMISALPNSAELVLTEDYRPQLLLGVAGGGLIDYDTRDVLRNLKERTSSVHVVAPIDATGKSVSVGDSQTETDEVASVIELIQ